ncbi:RNA polymerase II subunit B1 CTD phosphatase Rpap2 isoform X2 [Cylas formicarius]|uniref:RNA polymerase II subunit B1 CTD phosphatase Rpap2 isoform X2 n=1 Tax=Cylas formicarius TaxID=197179 RepID=UPI002958D4F3|nr:RNA polymerase II subunit B1 CTD phosphatase Rpap2 isoform X2 [Cylas formicarius]
MRAFTCKEIQATAQRKKDCDARAMKIVEFSIEGKLRPEVFTKCLPFITQEHYQDIVEERAITKLCGYSVCGKKIPEMPNKQYFISTKSNKVYDITERKNFCSNFCYKASMHIKRQIDNSPLWLRKLEDIPEYSLLNSSDEGLPGEYIDQGLIKPPTREQYFTSISSFTQASLDDLTDREIKAGKSKRDRPKHAKKCSRLKSTMQTIRETETEVVEEETVVSVSKSEVRTKTHKKETHKKSACVVNLPAIEENEEKIDQREPEESAREEMKKNKKKVTRAKLDVEGIVRRALDDWLTLETCIFIHGEEKVKAVLDEEKLSAYFETLKVMELQWDQQKRYMDVCRRLQLQEMADEKFDSAVVGDSKLMPLPDYKRLKEESKDMHLKVKSFFEGGLYEKKDTNFPQSKDGVGVEEVSPVLPPVDANSHHLIRRKIFLSSLNKAMHQLLQSLGVTYFSSTLSDVQSLVKTFRLSAGNVTFKPVIWNYIAVVLLHLLSLRDQSVKSVLQEKRSQEYIKLVTSPQGKNNFLDEILCNVQNVELFVQQYITSSKNV